MIAEGDLSLLWWFLGAFGGGVCVHVFGQGRTKCAIQLLTGGTGRSEGIALSVVVMAVK